MPGTQNVVVVANTLRLFKYTDFGAFAQNVHDKMVANAPIFSAPTPLMPALQQDITAFNTALNNWGAASPHGSHQDFLNLGAALHLLRQDINSEAAYVQALARTIYPGDITNQKLVVSKAGMRAKSDASPIGVFTQPLNLRQIVKNSYINSGLVYLRWEKPVMGSLVMKPATYIVEVASTISGTYAEIGVTGKTSFVAPAQSSGTIKYYRVVPVGTAGYGAVSDPCSTMAQ